MKTINLLLLPIICSISAYAQKLPNVQQVSLRAPDNVKVDGKADEWGKMQAYNSTTEVFYTLANDDKKLYLIIRSNDREQWFRLINGGVMLMVQKSGKKNDVGAVGVKFPLMESKKVAISGENGKKLDAAVINKNITANAKWIYTKGLLGEDSVIAVYNDSGIQVKNAVNMDGAYVSEMAIDLGLLGLLNNSNKFTYNIIINGEPNKHSQTFYPEKWHAVSKDGQPVSEADLQMAKQKTAQQFAVVSATTDFWGEYTLAK